MPTIESISTEQSTQATQQVHRRKRLLTRGGSTLLIATLVACGNSGSRKATSGDTSNGNTGDASISATSGNISTSGPSMADLPTIIFDDLGGGSSVIRVFPGVKDIKADKVSNGTFGRGDVAEVTCKTSGRTVVSDTTVGEIPKRSDVWVEIKGSPGLNQYATLTYADIAAGALAALPNCKDAP